MSREQFNLSVEYRDIPDFPGYRVGDDGSVWSSLLGGEWRRLKPSLLSCGRPIVSLRRKPKTKQFHVGSLILLVFVGPRPDGMECCHYDDDPTNNVLSNLRWDTRKANAQDCVRNGNMPHGAKHFRSQLTEADVIDIRRTYAAGGVTQQSLATKYGVSHNTVCHIIHRHSWNHI